MFPIASAQIADFNKTMPRSTSPESRAEATRFFVNPQGHFSRI